MNTFDRIKFLCDKKGFTIAELERKANVGNGTIRRWGETLPSSDKLQRVAKCLNVTMDYLVNDEEVDDAKDTEIRRIQRARNKMNVEDKAKMMKILEASFDDYFGDED